MADANIGYLTLLSIETEEIYGEMAGAEWKESGEGVTITALAGDGTTETFQQLSAEGLDILWFKFESPGFISEGKGRMLRLEKAEAPAGAQITVEVLE
ncbi:hypothetical protein BH11ARM1_BH11ARM1_09970 [soil metagenome]